MPAAITHYFEAKKAWDKFSANNVGEPFSENAFLWGAQGPDFFFCHNFLPWRKGESLCPYASKLHGALPSRLLGIMRGYAVSHGGDADIRSYIYGFLCHYSLDRTAHPFINSNVDDLKKIISGRSGSFLHCQIESAIDVIVLRAETGALPTGFDLKKTVPKDFAVMQKISRMYTYVLFKLLGEKVDEKNIFQAEKDCRLASGLLNDRTTFKKGFVERVEKRTGRYNHSCCIRGICEDEKYDYANILHSGWRYPEGSTVTRTESFFDLYDKSVDESAAFMRAFYSTEDLSALTGEIPFG
jgi:hypothetical protein